MSQIPPSPGNQNPCSSSLSLRHRDWIGELTVAWGSVDRSLVMGLTSDVELLLAMITNYLGLQNTCMDPLHI